jgi:microcystin-dependent protein
MPTHTHSASASTGAPNTAASPNGFWASGGGQIYGTAASLVTMAPQSSSNVGGSQPHENRPPVLTLNFIILLSGVFPSQN